MRKLFGFALAALFATAAIAAGVTASLTWTAPTVNTDGTSVTGALTYNVYVGPTAATLAATPAQTGIAALSDTLAAVAGTTSCYAVTAVEAGTEGAQSNVVCKTFPASVPVAPVLTVK